jgi:hypothetical protein
MTIRYATRTILNRPHAAEGGSGILSQTNHASPCETYSPSPHRQRGGSPLSQHAGFEGQPDDGPTCGPCSQPLPERTSASKSITSRKEPGAAS